MKPMFVRALVVVPLLAVSLLSAPTASSEPTYCKSLAQSTYWASRAFWFATQTPYVMMTRSERKMYDFLIRKEKEW